MARPSRSVDLREKLRAVYADIAHLEAQAHIDAQRDQPSMFSASDGLG